jgi:hypothetical protein
MVRGRKPKWHHPTKMMRLPSPFEAQLGKIADSLDLGEAVFSESDIQTSINTLVMQIRPRDREPAIRLYRKLMNHLLAIAPQPPAAKD